MKTTLLFFAFCTCAIYTQAQKISKWEVYNKNIDNNILRVRVNNTLYDTEPSEITPFLIKITHKYGGNTQRQQPTRAEAMMLVDIQDATKRILVAKTECILAGLATQKKTCDIYYYVKDTSGLRGLVNNYYKRKRYNKYGIEIREDRKWNEYFTVLCPNEEERQMIYYQRMVASLKRMGDKLKKPHKVTHWAFFKKEEDMKTFASFLQDKSYTVVSANKKPYSKCEIRFYHAIPLTADAILASVKDIKGQLALNAGLYGGWQTFVVR